MSNEHVKETEVNTPAAVMGRMLADLRRTALKKAEVINARERRKREVDEIYADDLEKLNDEEAKQVREAAEYFEEHRATLTGGKVQYFRADDGTIKLGPDSESFEILDAPAVEKWLRKMRLWSEFTLPAKRKLNTDKLKKARALVFKAPRTIMRYTKRRSIIIELTGVRSPLSHPLEKRVVEPPRDAI